jgi:hypothetical protein
MRLFHALLLLPLLGAPAFAQSDAPASAAHQGRRSAQQHFDDANTTHDGHLTMDQATSGYKSIAKSFKQIDTNHRGYVTLDDIKAWKAAKKAARQAAKHAGSTASDATDGVIRPVPAAHHWVGARALNTSTDMVVPAPTERPRMGVDLPKAPLDGAQSS